MHNKWLITVMAYPILITFVPHNLFNTLVDSTKIHQTVLFPDVREGVAELDELAGKGCSAKGIAVDNFSTIFRKKSGLTGVEFLPRSRAPRGGQGDNFDGYGFIFVGEEVVCRCNNTGIFSLSNETSNVVGWL